MRKPQTDPFAVLRLTPTLDASAVRAAWAAAVKRHPPHADADGFALCRTAYEELNTPAKLRDAWLASPFDAAAELAQLDAVDAAKLLEFRVQAAALRAQAAVEGARRDAVRQFGAVVSGWTWTQWEARARG